MASGVRIKLKPGAVEKLLRDPGIAADLEARAKRIALAAGADMVVETGRGRSRARASVITATVESARREARDRSLSSAVNAGRG